jgi:hypothetical protein
MTVALAKGADHVGSSYVPVKTAVTMSKRATDSAPHPTFDAEQLSGPLVWQRDSPGLPGMCCPGLKAVIHCLKP